MAATVDNKSDVSRQLGDDQENELLTAEEKEHSPTDPEKKEEVVEIEKDGSNLPEKTNHSAASRSPSTPGSTSSTSPSPSCSPAPLLPCWGVQKPPSTPWHFPSRGCSTP